MARSIAAPLATVFLCLSSGPTSTPLDAAISDTAQITRGTENRPLEAIDLASLRDVGPPFPDPRHHFIALSPNRRKVAFQVRQADPVSNTYRLQLLVMDVRPGATPEILDEGGDQIEGAHVGTPVTKAHIICHLLFKKKKQHRT